MSRLIFGTEIAVLVGLGLTVGCRNGAVGPAPNPCDVAKTIRGSPGFMTVAREAAVAARVLPAGFGGLYQQFSEGAAGSVVAYFKDPTSKADLRQALLDLLVCGGAYPGWAGELVQADYEMIQIQAGQYSADELLAFLEALAPLKSDPDVWAVDVDPQLNRVWIGLSLSAASGRVAGLVTSLGVPSAAVVLETPPPTTGDEQFEVISPLPAATVDGGIAGLFYFPLRVRFTNHQSATRYPDWCVNPDPETLTAYFNYKLQQWNGSVWNDIVSPVCELVLLPPRPVAPGQSVVDSIPVTGSRRLKTIPWWRTARITGTYRLVGSVYMSTVPNPNGGPASVADPAPSTEQVSRPFRLSNGLPY